MHYYAQGKVIVIDQPNLEFLDRFITKPVKYGFVMGPSSSGRTTVAKHIANKFGYTLIEWEPTISMLKEKLGTPEEPLDEVPYTKVVEYFRDRINAANSQETLLFDGFPYDLKQLNDWVTRVAPPTFIVHLSVEKDALTRR